jgi:hypothetical protein
MESEMSRISRNALLRAIQAVQEMNNEQKLGLAEEIFSSQPNMLGSVLVLPRAKQPHQLYVAPFYVFY